MGESERKCPTCGKGFGADVLFCPIDGSPLSRKALTGVSEPGADPYLGLVLLGQIELKRLAGIGSMARVYKALQRGVDRDVAVKILHRELSSNPEIVERFHREAKLASRLAHPNVVQVLLTTQVPPSGPNVGGELVMVMEYLDGMSLLSALSASGGALPLPRALHIVLQICEAVGEAHAQGVVHRDLKPENVMLVRRGDDPDFVKVLDFGLARMNASEASYATRAGAIFGSPRYISPEGAQGLPVAAPADVYAIATMLYQCLAGRTPFEAETAVGFLLAHANEKPLRINQYARASYVPEPIADLLEQSLSKRAEDRPADARAFARALLDASRRSGLLSDVLLANSWQSGGRNLAAGALASLSRTHAMNLTPLGKQELGQPLSTGTIAGDDAAFPPGGATRPPKPTQAPSPSIPPLTRPPEDKAPVAEAFPPESPDDGPPPFADRPNGVAPTLFDAPLAVTADTGKPPSVKKPTRIEEADDGKIPPPLPSQAPSLTPAPPESAAPSATPPPSAAPPAAAPSAPTTPPPADVAPPQPEPSRPAFSPATHTIPPDANSRSPLFRVAVVAALCFGAGALAAALGANRMGIFGHAQMSPADALLAEAKEAATRQEWDAPPGRNVRDLLQRGRAEHPADERFVDAQRRAATELLMLAAKERNGGRADEALRLSRIGLSIDPQNTLAQSLVDELSRAAAPSAPSSPPPPRDPPRPGGKRTSSPSPGSPSPNAPSPNAPSKPPPPPQQGGDSI